MIQPDEHAADQAAEWPPIEMFSPGRNGISEVEQDHGPMPDCIGSIPRRALHHERGAHQAEDRAGGADRQRVRATSSSAPNEPASSEAKYSATKRSVAERRLEHAARGPAGMYMLKPMCSRPRVQEAAGEQPPVLAVGDRAGAAQHEVRAGQAVAAARARRGTRSTLIAIST